MTRTSRPRTNQINELKLKNFESEKSLDAVRPVQTVGAVRSNRSVLLSERKRKTKKSFLLILNIKDISYSRTRKRKKTDSIENACLTQIVSFLKVPNRRV